MRHSGFWQLTARIVGLVWLLGVMAVRGQAPAPTEDMNHPQGTNAGIFGFTANCASCHDSGRAGAPDRYSLNRRTPEDVLAKMSSGAHIQHAQTLTEFQKRVIAVYLGGRPLGSAATGDASTMKNVCSVTGAFRPFSRSEWNGWGVDSANTRFQADPGLSEGDIPKLTLRWAFGFPYGTIDNASLAKRVFKLIIRRD